MTEKYKQENMAVRQARAFTFSAGLLLLVAYSVDRFMENKERIEEIRCKYSSNLHCETNSIDTNYQIFKSINEDKTRK